MIVAFTASAVQAGVSEFVVKKKTCKSRPAATTKPTQNVGWNPGKQNSLLGIGWVVGNLDTAALGIATNKCETVLERAAVKVVVLKCDSVAAKMGATDDILISEVWKKGLGVTVGIVCAPVRLPLNV